MQGRHGRTPTSWKADPFLEHSFDVLEGVVPESWPSSGRPSCSLDDTTWLHLRLSVLDRVHRIPHKSMMCALQIIPPSVAGMTEMKGTHALPWIQTLQSLREDQEEWAPPTKALPPIPVEQSTPPSRTDTQDSDSDDDLDLDLAKAALATGTQAFFSQQWEEADSLLQEALRILNELPLRQRTFTSTFALHYKLTICAFHIQSPSSAEAALLSLLRQPACTREELECTHHATHLLSQLYVRLGDVERARAECEKALQGRRRLMGKQSDAALESMALMAHVYVGLGNRALAKSCLAMIPEERRDDVLMAVEEELGDGVEHLRYESLLLGKVLVEADVASKRTSSRRSTSTFGTPVEKRGSEFGSTMPTSPGGSAWESVTSEETVLEDLHSFLKTTSPSDGNEGDRHSIEKEGPELRACSPCSEGHELRAHTPDQSPGSDKGVEIDIVFRKEILSKIGCQPRNQTEEAVCSGDHATLSTLLSKKRGFWRSSMRKRRPERVTALHFAALFGEVDMARRLIDAGFNINEVPFGYSTSLTPLNFAIGARQVAMVDFLVANGAMPSGTETWATLAGQLLSRSWIVKTMSELERELVPDRITAIMDILLKQEWDINEPVGSTGGTVLHQAVTFWTGSYKWDLALRGLVTSFLCEKGADPLHANAEGKTAYDLAEASGHQDLVSILARSSGVKELDDESVDLFEALQ